MTAERTATDVMTAEGMVAVVVMTAETTGVEVVDTTGVMTAGDMTAVIIMTDVMVVMTAEAMIAEAVVIDMTVGPKTGGHQIVMMVLEKGYDRRGGGDRYDRRSEDRRSPNRDDGPRDRPKLQLAKRSAPVEAAPSTNSSIF